MDTLQEEYFQKASLHLASMREKVILSNGRSEFPQNDNTNKKTSVINKILPMLEKTHEKSN